MTQAERWKAQEWRDDEEAEADQSCGRWPRKLGEQVHVRKENGRAWPGGAGVWEEKVIGTDDTPR